MKPEFITLIGLLLSAVIGAASALFVGWIKSKFEKETFEKNLDLQVQRFRREITDLKSGRKMEIAHKYAELAAKDKDLAAAFLNEIAKETAIGFLYLEDSDDKPKIWIRNDSNILVGRHSSCDICIEDVAVSRQHCVIHTIENEAWVIPLKPTNPIFINGRSISLRSRLLDKDILLIGETELEFFEFKHGDGRDGASTPSP